MKNRFFVKPLQPFLRRVTIQTPWLSRLNYGSWLSRLSSVRYPFYRISPSNMFFQQTRAHFTSAVSANADKDLAEEQLALFLKEEITFAAFAGKVPYWKKYNYPNLGGGNVLTAAMKLNHDFARIRELIENGAPVIGEDMYGNSALIIAANRADMECLQYLLGVTNNLSVVDYRRNNLLHLVVLKSPDDILSSQIIKDIIAKQPGLLDQKNYAGDTPLNIAIKNKNYVIAKLLIDSGAKLDSESFLRDAANTNQHDLVKVMLLLGAKLPKEPTTDPLITQAQYWEFQSIYEQSLGDKLCLRRMVLLQLEPQSRLQRDVNTIIITRYLLANKALDKQPDAQISNCAAQPTCSATSQKTK
jgi:hypothetical protein